MELICFVTIIDTQPNHRYCNIYVNITFKISALKLVSTCTSRDEYNTYCLDNIHINVGCSANEKEFWVLIHFRTGQDRADKNFGISLHRFLAECPPLLHQTFKI